mmetsp:Transcript_25523/g.37678  ORF Transcript_25523/g.37678 Transcript_25523/m.37678 type:complete len:829 (+) Transcript_25523:68-2554(+)
MDTALESSVWVVSPEYSGYLMKKGFHWMKLWKKRWVVLKGSEIAYMSEKPVDGHPSDEYLITKTQITSATVIDREDVDNDPHGFSIHINDGNSPAWHLRAESSREKRSWLMRLNHVHTIVRWLDEFEKIKVLGVGGAGIVHELLHKTNGQRYAMKEMELTGKAQLKMAVAEAEILKDIMETISHPNILNIEKVFQVGNKFYLVFPLCTGGELYEQVVKRGHFTELDAAVIMRDLISALHELHSHDILHLDIKPENILFESDAPDARIKLTDFGLSKVFHSPAEGTTDATQRIPTMDELTQKMKAFEMSGVLNRDSLRGTVGYMSPELILAGVSSRATDIWAAGVVLYILLCGIPPFHSRSNREILEKSARGEFSLDGKEWEGVSDEAKDLVSKMLTVDPSRRITASEILQHPWIRMVDDSSTSVASQDTVSDTMISFPHTSAVRRQSASSTHLNSALRKLSGHVQERKIEKLASNFSRLVSSMQMGGANGTNLMSLVTDEGNSDGTDGTTEGGTLMASEMRDRLVQVFQEMGATSNGGRLTVDQFTQILSQVSGAEDKQSGVMMLICRFIDSDGDGLISPEDILQAEARIQQRNPQFLKAVFRAYTEAVWYPGRHFNQMKMIRGGGTKGQIMKSILTENTQDTKSSDVVEPPKFITARNVSAVFERLGYSPEVGTKIFNALCAALARRRAQNSGTRTVSSTAESPPPPPSPSSSTSGQSDTNTPKKPGRNAALSALVSGNKPNTSSSPSPASPAPVPTQENTQADTTASTDSEGIKISKMDVNDFIDAVAIDDVLVRILQLKPRKRMMEMMMGVTPPGEMGAQKETHE